MSTYDTLRDRALGQVGLTGVSEAQTVAQTALEEAMKYVAYHVRILSLIGSATATAPASPTLESNAISLTAAGGFNISAGTYQKPDRLFVKKDSSTDGYGTPYEFREYHHFLDLKAIPGVANGGSRIFEPDSLDERPDFCFTETPSGKIWVDPLTQNNVITLFYKKSPAAYSGSATPEIAVDYDYILVNGAVVALKEWLREPEQITTLWQLFDTALKPDCERYDLEINAKRKRRHLKIHRSYRVS